MDAVKLSEELMRMCRIYEDCYECPIGSANHLVCIFSREINPRIDLAEFVEDIAKVEKWSAEHPIKTKLMDFLEKHPNAPLNNGAPLSPPRFAGYCKAPSCRECKLAKIGTSSCWNLPLEDES